MKAVTELEPGILPTFRLFIGIQLGVSVLNVITHWLAPFWVQSEVFRLPRFSTFGVLVAGLLFFYLLVPGLGRILGAFYLPIGISWATAGAFLETYVELHSAGSDISEMRVSFVLLRQIVLLLIPLIVVSWQYSMRQAVLFCALATVLNIILLSQIVLPQELITGFLLGIVGIQIIVFLLVGYMVENLVKVQREQRQSLTEANQRLAQYASTLEQLAISRERNRMARELHDTVAHTLSGLAVQLEGARSLSNVDPPKSNAMLERSIVAIRSGLTEMRKAIQSLRATPLEDLGVDLAVRELGQNAAERAGFAFQFEKSGDHWKLSEEVEQCIYRVAQEALENIVRHARAKHVHLSLSHQNGRISLIVVDDGIGFDPTRLNHEDRYGIRGMRERAELVGGHISIESEPGKGSILRFELKHHD